MRESRLQDAPAHVPESPDTATSQLPPSPHLARRNRLVAGLAALVLIVGVGVTTLLVTRHSTGTTARQTPSATVAPRAPSAAIAAAYVDPDHYYTAKFDGTPAHHATTETTAAGVVPYRYAEYAAPGVDQLVGVLVLGPATAFDPEKGLEGMASTGHGVIESSRKTTFQGYPSVEGVIRLAGAYLKVQVVHVDRLAYVIGTAGAADPPGDYQRFIATVRLTPH